VTRSARVHACRLVPLLAAALLLASPAVAWGTSNDCAKAPNGSPCSTQCLQDGQCMNGQCLGGHPVIDGTSCATGLLCTTGDSCLLGECRAGSPVSCSPGPCGPEQCIEGVGCSAISPCDMPPGDGSAGDAAQPPPDLSRPIEWTRPDLVMTDASPSGDGGPPDLGVPGDMPPPADLRVGPGADLSRSGDGPPPGDAAAPGDAGVPPDDLGLPGDLSGQPPADLPAAAGDGGPDLAVPPYQGPWHIHGSGCAVGGHGEQPWALAGLLLGLAIAVRRRR
jgi:MYXO-CTERM domain-containing protein